MWSGATLLCFRLEDHAWNNLDLDIRQSPSLNVFKSRLTTLYKSREVPVYFSLGQRYTSIIHARLRNGCSNLNSDLFNNHIRDDSHCDCGQEKEDFEHLIFSCPNYAQARLTFFHNTRLYHPISTNKLLYGLQGASDHSNKQLINSFHTYINATQRFNQSQ